MSSSTSDNEQEPQINRNTAGGNESNNGNVNTSLNELDRILNEGTAAIQETYLDNEDNSDVLFRGSVGQGIPGFSITIGRTNINNGPITEDPVFNINNLPDNLRRFVENHLRNARNREPGNRRATKDAIKHLKIIEPLSLKEPDRLCSICYEDYDNVESNEEKEDEDHIEQLKLIYKKTRQSMNDDPEILLPADPLVQNYAKYQRLVKDPDHDDEIKNHIPVQMPCGHIFGRSCLIEWLKEHVSCPFCRREIESQQTNAPKQRVRSEFKNPRYLPANIAGEKLNRSDDPGLPFPSQNSRSNRGNFSIFGNPIFN